MVIFTYIYHKKLKNEPKMYSNVHTSPMDLDIIPPLKKRTFSPLIHFDVLSLGVFFPKRNPRSLTSKTQEEETQKKMVTSMGRAQ